LQFGIRRLPAPVYPGPVREAQSSEDEAAREAERVSAYLRAHPGFLAERPELYRGLAPPRRVHGEVVADHMAAMLRAARDHASELEAKARALLDGRRAASGMTERVQEAVLALIRAPDVTECVVDVFPGLLGVDAASLCCEGFSPRWRSLPSGAIRQMMRGRRVVFRDRPADAILLHAEAEFLAERDVLVRLPVPRPSLLALVSRDSAVLPALQGSQSFRFLASVIAALIAP
jgi:uncharacterized protein YigA (DUF484 family)